MEHAAPWNSGSNTGWPHCRFNPALQHMQGTRPRCRAVCPLLLPASHWDLQCSRSISLATWPRAPLPAPLPESMTNIGVSWNKGYCTFPGMCRFGNACATFQQPHMARDCAATPADSEYKHEGGGRNPASCPGPRPLFDVAG